MEATRSKRCEKAYPHIEWKLADYLEAHGITTRTLAYAANLRHDTVLGLCQGTVKRVGVETLARICCALGCGVEDIIAYRKGERLP